jgi:dTDP-glucose 4,6-dehydratase
MNILVTGGCGFIGSHFVLRHRAKHPEDTIVVLDKLTYAADRSLLAPIEQDIVFFKGDITEASIVSHLVDDHAVDAIVNFAAETHVDRSIENPIPFIHTNILGVQSLIEVCKLHPTLRFLHISTDEVYGDIDDDDPPRTVASCLIPSSPYAASKAAGDLLIIAAMRTYGIKACITRCTNNYGPHQALEKFIPTVFRHALKDEPVPVYGEGKNKRDWLYVTDHCDALELLLHTSWAFNDPVIKSGHLFNISANDERQNIAVATMILDLLGKPRSLISFVKDRPGHDWRYALDSSLIRKLGWKPTVSFMDGLQNTVEWYKKRLEVRR